MFEGLTEEYIEQTKPRLEAWRNFIRELDPEDTKLAVGFNRVYKEIYAFANGDSEFEEADNDGDIYTYLHTMDIDDMSYSPHLMLSMLREYRYYVIENSEKLNK